MANLMTIVFRPRVNSVSITLRNTLHVSGTCWSETVSLGIRSGAIYSIVGKFAHNRLKNLKEQALNHNHNMMLELSLTDEETAVASKAMDKISSYRAFSSPS